MRLEPRLLSYLKSCSTSRKAFLKSLYAKPSSLSLALNSSMMEGSMYKRSFLRYSGNVGGSDSGGTIEDIMVINAIGIFSKDLSRVERIVVHYMLYCSRIYSFLKSKSSEY